MSKDSIIFIGLDTHKSFIQVAVLQEHRGANPQQLGRIKSNKSALIKLAKQLQSTYTPGRRFAMRTDDITCSSMR